MDRSFSVKLAAQRHRSAILGVLVSLTAVGLSLWYGYTQRSPVGLNALPFEAAVLVAISPNWKWLVGTIATFALLAVAFVASIFFHVDEDHDGSGTMMAVAYLVTTGVWLLASVGLGAACRCVWMQIRDFEQ